VLSGYLHRDTDGATTLCLQVHSLQLQPRVTMYTMSVMGTVMTERQARWVRRASIGSGRKNQCWEADHWQSWAARANQKSDRPKSRTSAQLAGGHGRCGSCQRVCQKRVAREREENRGGDMSAQGSYVLSLATIIFAGPG